jgi:hypothetical protein
LFQVLGKEKNGAISQTGEVLSDVGQNESKIKRNNFPAGLDKVGGFIEEAQGFNPGTAVVHLQSVAQSGLKSIALG